MAPPRAPVLLALLLAGCTRDCAGPLSATTVARAEGPQWRATLRCEPRTKLGAGRGDLLERQGCTAQATLTVEGRARRVAQVAHDLTRDRDCGRVRAYCRALRGRVVSRATSEGTVIAAAADGMQASLVGHVTTEGFAFRREALPVHGAPDAVLAAAPTPDALLTAMLRGDDFARGGRPDLGEAFAGATLQRLRAPLWEAAARCAAPTEALTNLAVLSPDTFDALYAQGWSGPSCANTRLALERAHRDRTAARVAAQLAATRGATPAAALDALVVTVGRIAVREALAAVSALARATPGSPGFNDAVWIHAVWAWWRVDPSGAVRACAAMQGAPPGDAPPEGAVRPFDGAVPRWDPRARVLARCVASGDARGASPARVSP
ncbi:MAG: hypothetical protein U0325_02355 [Polyangiales bacterium]